jgi:hypothetical protein
MKLFALLISMATAIGFLIVPAAATAAEQPATPAVVFSADDSGILQPGENLGITGTITNTAKTELAAGVATAYIDRGAVATRADLDSWTTSDDTVATDKLGTAMASVVTPAIAPGRTVAVSIPVPSAAVGLSATGAWGARTIAVQVTAAGAPVGQSRSSIVWDPPNAVTPVALSLAMPLTVPATNTGLIPEATLATYTAPGGLLTRELDQAISRHIAIGIDPMIIVSIRILGSSAPASAKDWLQRLQTAPNETFPLTYADSDVAVADQAGAHGLLAPTSFDIDPKLFPGYTVPPTTTPTATASATPSPTPSPSTTPAPELPTAQTIAEWDYTPALAGIVWPSDDTVVEADLDSFAQDGFTTTILSSGNISYSDPDSATTASATVDKQAALISDAQLSALFRAAVAAPDDAGWQKAMADLSAGIALASQKRGNATGPMLATLGRNDPTENTRLAQTLEALASLPWAGFAKLSDLADGTTPASATISAKPESSNRVATVTSMLDSEASVGTFSTVLQDPTVLTGERRLTLLALLGNSWQNDLPDWLVAAQKYSKACSTTIGSVSIAKTGSQFLPSDTVNLQVSVTNDLQWPVTVFVTVTSPNGAIQVQNSRIQLTIEGNSQSKAAVPVRALANGDVSVRASLSSATDVPIGTPRLMDVNVHAGWETVFTAVVAVLVAGVFGFGIYRNIAKRRRRKRNGSDPDAEPAEPETPAS